MTEQGEPAGGLEPPDAHEVNRCWAAEPEARRGLARLIERLLGRVLGPRFEAQRAFNAAQVRLDNALLEHLSARLDASHRHYDALLGALGRRQDEADERHRQLERELVSHVRELVERIDLVLLETTRDKHRLAHALEEVRERLARLEQALARR